jgi:hypothetical protein
MSNTRSTTPARRRALPPAGVVEGVIAGDGTGDGTDDGTLYITFMDKRYKVAEKTGIWPLMQFARAAEAGASAMESRGLAAIHAFLQDVIDPEDWGRFQEDMIAQKVTDLAALMDAAREAVEAVFARQAAEQAKTGPAGTPAAAANGHAAPAAAGKIRASDKDRDQAAERLAAALADGRITAEEHADRLAAVMSARTVGEFSPLFDDLPDPV